MCDSKFKRFNCIGLFMIHIFLLRIKYTVVVNIGLINLQSSISLHTGQQVQNVCIPVKALLRHKINSKPGIF